MARDVLQMGSKVQMPVEDWLMPWAWPLYQRLGIVWYPSPYEPNSKLLSAIYLCVAASATSRLQSLTPQVGYDRSGVSDQHYGRASRRDSLRHAQHFFVSRQSSRGLPCAEWRYEQVRSYSPLLEGGTFEQVPWLKKMKRQGPRVTTEVDLEQRQWRSARHCE